MPVSITFVRGKKGPGDRLPLVTAYGEPLPFDCILEILDSTFKAENSYYPISSGNLGAAMLMEAILEVYSGIPLDRVLAKFKLVRKTVVFDRTVSTKKPQSFEGSQNLKVADFI